jgi:2'-5' RNA ligase
MPFAIELFLDEQSDHRIRQIWAALEDRGIPSLGAIAGSDYHPHVTLVLYDHGPVAPISNALTPMLTEAAGLPLSLESLGFFLTHEAPAFLGVVPTEAFLNLHKRVYHALHPLARSIADYYRPDALMPHCTLAMHVADKAAVIDVVSRFPTPIPAHVATVQLVEIPGGHSRTQLA